MLPLQGADVGPDVVVGAEADRPDDAISIALEIATVITTAIEQHCGWQYGARSNLKRTPRQPEMHTLARNAPTPGCCAIERIGTNKTRIRRSAASRIDSFGTVTVDACTFNDTSDDSSVADFPFFFSPFFSSFPFLFPPPTYL